MSSVKPDLTNNLQDSVKEQKRRILRIIVDLFPGEATEAIYALLDQISAEREMAAAVNARMEELTKFENLKNPDVLAKLYVILHKRMEVLSKKLNYSPECSHQNHKVFNYCPYTPLQRWRAEQEFRQPTGEDGHGE